jgi:diadenosine tetraphosphate (Ap4A) HIT family hydrolase
MRYSLFSPVFVGIMAALAMLASPNTNGPTMVGAAVMINQGLANSDSFTATQNNTQHVVRPDCLFCNIKSRGGRIIYEDEKIVGFWVRSPATNVHTLFVPVVHYDSIKSLNVADIPLLEHMARQCANYLTEQGIASSDFHMGFHVPPWISQHHMHMHCMDQEFKNPKKPEEHFRDPAAWISLQNTIEELRKHGSLLPYIYHYHPEEKENTEKADHPNLVTSAA